MKKKKLSRTEFMTLAATVRTAYNAAYDAWQLAAAVNPKTRRRLFRAMDALQAARCEAESEMYRQHPDWTDREAKLDVFYGRDGWRPAVL